MKRFYVGTIGVLVIGFALVGCLHQPSGQTDAGWTTLLAGRWRFSIPPAS